MNVNGYVCVCVCVCVCNYIIDNQMTVRDKTELQ
jgi:hypothetical protein